MAPRNCGLVTFLNNNKTRNIAEIGHNFGANHEEDTPCEAAAGRLMAAFEEPHSSRAESFSNCASQCVSLFSCHKSKPILQLSAYLPISLASSALYSGLSITGGSHSPSISSSQSSGFVASGSAVCSALW